MKNWWHDPSSLNWINKKKLSDNIKKFDSNINYAKQNLISLLSLLNNWESHCCELSEKSKHQQLTAKHLVDLKPLLEKSESFKEALQLLCVDSETTQLE